MPAIDFPSAPAVNDEYSFEGRTWRWNGTGWEVKEYPAALLAGTAANPSLYFSGDANTGLYSPGADQVALSTGGTGRLFVDASGRLLVGTSSSRDSRAGGTVYTNTLQIEADTNQVGIAITRFTDSSIGSFFSLQKGRGTIASPTVVSSGDAIGDIRFSGFDGTNFSNGAGIRAEVDGTPGANDMPGRLVFSTTADGAASPTERLRITSAGNVGIGGTPATKLDIAANNTSLSALNTLRFTDTDTTSVATQETGRIEFYTSDTTQVGVHSYISAQTLDSNSNGALTFGTGLAGSASERLRIDNTGRVLIGTSTATGTSQLQVGSGTRLGGLSLLAGNTIASNVDLANASYDSVSFSVAGEELNPQGIFFSPDGRKMFIIGSTGDDINEYTLSTPWNVSTATYVTVFFVQAQENVPNDLYFRDDGKKLYIVGSTNDTVYQYSLSTPWSIASASYDSVSFSVVTEESATTGFSFKPDGLAFYVIGQAVDTVFRYNLSTAWDISTATLANSFSVVAQETSPQSVSFTADGSRMFVMGNTGDDVNIYNLTTPWDITTAAFVTVVSVAAQENSPSGMFVKPDGSKLYIVGITNDTVYQYSIPSATIDLTGTTNINGSAEVAQDLTVWGDITGGGKLHTQSPSAGIGYITGAGGAITQVTSRTTGVTLNRICGAITLVSAAGSTAWQSFTVTNSTVAATDNLIVNQKSGTDLYMIHVTNVAAGSFQITFATTGGTTTEQPVFNFSIIKAVAA